jgi:hypothetical protein
VSGDDLADRIGVYETGEENKGDQMVVEDFGVEVQVGGKGISPLRAPRDLSPRARRTAITFMALADC